MTSMPPSHISALPVPDKCLKLFSTPSRNQGRKGKTGRHAALVGSFSKARRPKLGTTRLRLASGSTLRQRHVLSAPGSLDSTTTAIETHCGMASSFGQNKGLGAGSVPGRLASPHWEPTTS